MPISIGMAEFGGIYEWYYRTFLNEYSGPDLNNLWIVSISPQEGEEKFRSAIKMEAARFDVDGNAVDQYGIVDGWAGKSLAAMVDSTWQANTAVLPETLNIEGWGSSNVLVAVNNVMIPTDVLNTKNAEMGPGYTWVPPMMADLHQPFQPLQLSFYYTAYPFSEFIVRPWTMAVNRYGLKLRCLRAHIVCTLFSRRNMVLPGTNNWVPKFQYIFYSCYPQGTPNITLDYNDDGIDKTSQIGFGYDFYRIRIPLAKYPNIRKASEDFEHSDEFIGYIRDRANQLIRQKDEPVFKRGNTVAKNVKSAFDFIQKGFDTPNKIAPVVKPLENYLGPDGEIIDGVYPDPTSPANLEELRVVGPNTDVDYSSEMDEPAKSAGQTPLSRFFAQMMANLRGVDVPLWVNSKYKVVENYLGPDGEPGDGIYMDPTNSVSLDVFRVEGRGGSSEPFADETGVVGSMVRNVDWDEPLFLMRELTFWQMVIRGVVNMALGMLDTPIFIPHRYVNELVPDEPDGLYNPILGVDMYDVPRRIPINDLGVDWYDEPGLWTPFGLHVSEADEPSVLGGAWLPVSAWDEVSDVPYGDIEALVPDEPWRMFSPLYGIMLDEPVGIGAPAERVGADEPDGVGAPSNRIAGDEPDRISGRDRSVGRDEPDRTRARGASVSKRDEPERLRSRDSSVAKGDEPDGISAPDGIPDEDDEPERIPKYDSYIDGDEPNPRMWDGEMISGDEPGFPASPESDVPPDEPGLVRGFRYDPSWDEPQSMAVAGRAADYDEPDAVTTRVVRPEWGEYVGSMGFGRP